MRLQFLVAIICMLLRQSLTENVARYDNYRMYIVHFENSEQVKVFQDLEAHSDSCMFMGHARQVGQTLSILVAAHKIADFADLLQRYTVEHDILSYNYQKSIDAQFESVQPKDIDPSKFDWHHYFHLDSINAWLDKEVQQHSDRLSPITIGTSYNGLPIRGVKLSTKPNNTAIVLEAGIHAREWISPATATFILNQLLHSTDTAVRDVATSFDWYILPVINPDGYKYTFEHDRMWRKTRQPFGVCCGTDMNRNFDSNWNGTGSSPDACRYDFAGSRMNSEPEAAALSDFVLQLRNETQLKTFISLHSFSQLMMFPFGHSSTRPKNYDDLLSMGEKAVAALAQRYGTKYLTGSIHDIIYPSSGGSMDWAYERVDIPVAFTLELRGPPTSSDMFNLPADQIEPVGWETLDAFVALLQEARRLGYYNDV